LLKDLDLHRLAVPRINALGVVVMFVTIVVMVGFPFLSLMVSVGAQQHPNGDPDNQYGGCELEVRLGTFGVELFPEVEAYESDRPNDRRVRDRRRQTEQDCLRHGAANRDDESGHHRLRMAGLQPV
jgi:hypothetical protein